MFGRTHLASWSSLSSSAKIPSRTYYHPSFATSTWHVQFTAEISSELFRTSFTTIRFPILPRDQKFTKSSRTLKLNTQINYVFALFCKRQVFVYCLWTPCRRLRWLARQGFSRAGVQCGDVPVLKQRGTKIRQHHLDFVEENKGTIGNQHHGLYIELIYLNTDYIWILYFICMVNFAATIPRSLCIFRSARSLSRVPFQHFVLMVICAKVYFQPWNA